MAPSSSSEQSPLRPIMRSSSAELRRLISTVQHTMDALKLQRRRTAAPGTIWPPKRVIQQPKLSQIIQTHVQSQSPMKLGRNQGKLFGSAEGLRYFEWKPTISKKRYDLLLKLRYPNIINIDEVECPVDDDELSLEWECVLRILNPIGDQTALIEGLIDLHRMSVDDVINSQRILILAIYQMCKNILAALDYLSHESLVMGDFSAKDIAYTATGYKIMNVDKSETADGRAEITDLRSVGEVMIKMLTTIEINNTEALKLPNDKLDHSEDYTDCRLFLEIASKEQPDLGSYRKQLLHLKDVQLATWTHTFTHTPSEEELLERSRGLSVDVGLQQPSVL